MTALAGFGYDVEVLPDVGGAIGRFSFAGKAVLRPAPTGADVGDTGCFPLIPFANRIAQGCFSFGGHDVHLSPTFAGHPHALHGHGWKNAWTVAEQTDQRLTLRYAHAPDLWPWSYVGEMRFVLSQEGLRVSLAAINTGDEPMPLSLGLHPWFVRTPATVLSASVDGVWLADDTVLPTERVEGTRLLDLGRGAALATTSFVDHCHTGWSGPAIIDQPDLGYRAILTANCPFLHIYAPVGADFVCAEPVSAMPDAFNRAPASETGLCVLPPGGRFEIAMRIAVEPY